MNAKPRHAQVDAPALLAAANPEASIEAGREGLDHWWRYPWYDSRADQVQPIDVSEPWYMRWDWPEWLENWNWPSFSWGSGPDLGTMIQWAAWIAIAVALIALVSLLIRAYLGREPAWRPLLLRRKDEKAKEDAQRIESLPFPVRAARSDLLGESRRHYQEGKYGEAVKFLFSHQLVELDKHQRIRLARGKTNRQYLRELGAGRPLGRLVEGTMVVFEDFFFGGYTIDRGRFEVCWSQLEQFEALLGEKG